jgi:hypothetical protein
MQTHKEFECPRRMVGCLYCGLQVPFYQRGEHQGMCGNRTATCSLCHTLQKRNSTPPSPNNYLRSPAYFYLTSLTQ